MIAPAPFSSSRDLDSNTKESSRRNNERNIFYDQSQRAPYLEITSDEIQMRAKHAGSLSINHLTKGKNEGNSMNNDNSRSEEADTAAGGASVPGNGSGNSNSNSVLKRVSSFNIMSRSSNSINNANNNDNNKKGGSSRINKSSINNNNGINNNKDASKLKKKIDNEQMPSMRTTTTTAHGQVLPVMVSPPHSSRGDPFAREYQKQGQSGGISSKFPTGATTSNTTNIVGSSTSVGTNFNVKTSNNNTLLTPSWRLRDRMKTVGVGLVMALNVGTDPPDLTKPHPCAKLQCWMDPSSVTRAKAKEKIGERLEAQYARWQQQRAARPLKYRRALDPTVEDVRGLCLWLRRQARHERILLHYNGHGVPRPTANGEIWVFDKNHTEYIPLSVSDLRQWMGKPSIVILDCSSAGILIPFLTCSITETPPNTPPRQQGQSQQPASAGSGAGTTTDMETAASNWVKDTIVLCPTSDQEWLPMHPDYPADIFTSCLTTPIKIALRWFVRRNRQSVGGLNPEAVDAIPGKAIDRKTPLGELNWIFTAVTDSIAWNLLPKPLFQRLFRQDLLVASMFRNFLLADRILRSLNCTPQSYPPLPPGVADHPLWQAWDLACETCLFGLIKDGILGNHVVKPPPSASVPHSAATMTTTPPPTTGEEQMLRSTASGSGGGGGGGRDVPAALKSQPVKNPSQYSGSARTKTTTSVTIPASSISSPFFSEQLTAFEIWLEFASIHKATLKDNQSSPATNPPLESPEQLPVVLQVLLSQVHRIRALLLLRRFLDLGPWAVNLSLRLGIFPYVMKLLQSPEYKTLLVSIWASILKFDPSCQVDLVKDGALPHFIQPLTSWGAAAAAAAAAVPHHHGAGSNTRGSNGDGGSTEGGGPTNNHDVVMDAAKLRTLAAFSLAATCNNYSAAQSECLRQNLHGHCCALLSTFIQQQQREQRRHLSPQDRHPQQAQMFRGQQQQACQNFDIIEDTEYIPPQQQLPPASRLWLCLCLGNLLKNHPTSQNEAYNTNVHLCLISCSEDMDPSVRAAVCYALGCLLEATMMRQHAVNVSSTGGGISGGAGVHHSHQVPPQGLGSPIYSPNSPGGPFPTGPQVLVPQHMSATTMTVPAALTASAVLSGQLQPTMSNRHGSTNPIWHPSQQQQQQKQHQPQQQQKQRQLQPTMQPQHSGLTSQPQLQPQPQLQQTTMDKMMPPSTVIPQAGLHLGPLGQQQLNVPLLHQTHLLPPQGQGMPPPHMMVPPTRQHGGGPNPVMNVMGAPHNPTLLAPPHHPPTSLMMNPMMAPPLLQQQRAQQRQPTIFDDRRRLELDLLVMEVLLKALDDGCSVVRYETIMALAQFVGKYLLAYLVVAEETSNAVSSSTVEGDSDEIRGSMLQGDHNKKQQKDETTPIVPIPHGLTRPLLDRFAYSWKALRRVQHKDAHPFIAQAANTLVSVVHEQFLDLLMESKVKSSEQEQDMERSGDAPSGFQEDGIGSALETTKAGSDLERSDSDHFLTPRRKERSSYQQDAVAARSDGPIHRLPDVKLYPLRRTSSDHGPPFGWQQSAANSSGIMGNSRNSMHSASGGPPAIPDAAGDGLAQQPNTKSKEYTLPKSSFYEWKKTNFLTNYDDAEDGDLVDQDPLCPSGAARAYQQRRNIAIHDVGNRLANRFSGLAPKVRKTKQGWDKILEHDDDADEKDSSLKGDLKLREKKLLRNDGVKMTSMLKFHSYEDVLMVCDNKDGISIWDHEEGHRCSVFQNGNPKGSRMTSAFWINESSTSLFFVGCDDGSARIWDGIVDSSGEISRQKPLTLASAFFAVPDMEAGQRGSGLICDWQQFSGTLIAGGNSDSIRCWDLGSEQCQRILETNTEACVTTLTTAWDSDQGVMSGGYHGMGPDIVVAGHSDGSLKVFDIRSPDSGTVRGGPSAAGSGGRSRRPPRYTEHGSWIVDISFTSYGGRFEVISGCFDGDMRAWDLRMSSSIRTLDVQRSPMTALSVHKQIPIAATGSHAQFIKILTLEGETLQVARFHEELSGHRIGPVSCLEFHKQKLVLAAGAANSLVSIYKPKHVPSP